MPKLQKLYILLALVLLVFPLLVACGNTPTPTVAPAATPTPVATTLAPTAVALPTEAPTTIAPTTPDALVGTSDWGFTYPTTEATLSAYLPFQVYKSYLGNFSVDFPGEPELSTTDHTITSIPNVTYYTTFIVNKNLTFFVAYFDNPYSDIGSSTPDSIIDQTFKNTDSSVKLSDIKAIKLGSVPGEEVTSTKGDTVGYYHVYVDGIRIYQVAVLCSGGVSMPLTVGAFFDSFKITSANTTAITDPATAKRSSTDDLTEVKLDQVFYDNFASQFKDVTKLKISFFTSNIDPATLSSILDREATLQYYNPHNFAITKDPWIGQFNKTGQPDYLFDISNTPTDVTSVQKLWTGLDATANQASITKLLAQLKGAKALVVIVSGTGVLDSYSATTNSDATPTPGEILPTEAASGDNAFTPVM